MELRRGGGAVVLQQQALYTQVEAGGLLLAGPAPNLLPAPAALAVLRKVCSLLCTTGPTSEASTPTSARC